MEKNFIIVFGETENKENTINMISTITFSGNNPFKDIEQKSVSQSYSLPMQSLPADSFEKHQQLKQPINKNKILGGIALGASIVAAITFRKNIASTIKKLLPKSNEVLNDAVEQTKKKYNSVQEVHDELINNAKDFLINSVKKWDESTANGICFHGPNSKGKEQLIEGFISDLAEAGYEIKRIPRVQENTDFNELNGIIHKTIKEAEELFKTSHKRTAIIVRDLDQIAPDRNVELINNATGTLLQVEKCRERGFAWIAEAVDYPKVDLALQRRGRIDHLIVSRPSLEDSRDVWNEYLNMIVKKFREGERRDLWKFVISSIGAAI